MLVSAIYISKILAAIYMFIKYKIQPYESTTKTFWMAL